MKPEAIYSSDDVCDIVGISYRQLDWWLRTGVIDACQPGHGSGSRRRFSRADLSDITLVDAVRKWVWSPHRAAQLISEMGPDAIRPGGQITVHTDGPMALIVDIDELERLLDERISAAFPEERATA